MVFHQDIGILKTYCHRSIVKEKDSDIYSLDNVVKIELILLIIGLWPGAQY